MLFRSSHEAKTTIDGKPLTNPGTGLKFGATAGSVVTPGRRPIPGTQWEVVTIQTTSPAGEGSHVIVSDTSVGLYLYGYTNDDSYAWAGALGVRSPNSPDTLPPIAIPENICYCAKIKLYDNRLLDTKLNSISTLDSIYNMTFYPDTAFIDGRGIDSSYYEICVIDSSQEAYISVSVYDVAGNRTTIVSTYKPAFLTFTPPIGNFGSGQIGQPGYIYDTICNTGTEAFDFKSTNTRITDKNKGFAIDSIGADGPIPPGGCRIIKLKYVPAVGSTVSDSLEITDGCMILDQPLFGNGGSADFLVLDYPFPCTTPGTTATSTKFYIQNTSKFALKIDTIWVEDAVHFGYNPATPGNALPVTVPPTNIQSGKVEVFLTFSPTIATNYTTRAHFLSKQDNIEHIVNLTGKGCAATITATDQTNSSECDNDLALRVSFENTGSDIDQLDTLVASDTTHFSLPVIDDGSGNQLTTPLSLDVGKSIFVSVKFQPTPGTSGCFSDTIYVIHPGGDTAGRAIAKGCTTYRGYEITRREVDFNSLPFNSPKVTDIFTFCDTTDDPTTITSFITNPSPKDGGAFRLTGVYKVAGVPVNIPIVLKKGDCVDVEVEFDPSFALDVGQVGVFGVVTNACDTPSREFWATAATLSGPPNIQGFNLPAIFACGNADSAVKIPNKDNLMKTIDSVWIDGPNGANFVSTQKPPIVVPPLGTGSIPIKFTPDPLTGAQNYTATIHVIVSDGSRSDTLTALLSASSNNYDLAFNSGFAKTGLHFGDDAPLNINLNLNKNGVTDPLSKMDVRTITLTYAYDIDLLDVPANLTNILTNSTWTLDAAASVAPTTANPQLTVVLRRATPLDDADKLLGTLVFKATLPRTTPSSQMTLVGLTLQNSLGDTVRNCVVTTHRDTSITVVYQCGDSTLFKFMNGQNPIFGIVPATPNPISGADRTATLRYLLRREATVSLSIFDPLGKEIDRLEEDVRHPAGSFEVFYDTRKLPAGSYVYRFTFDGKDVRSGRFVIER